MQKVLLQILISILLCVITAFALPSNQVSLIDKIYVTPEYRAAVVESSREMIKINFDLQGVEGSVFSDGNLSYSRFSLPGEGFTFEKNKPLLPAATRVVIVPPDCGLELSVATSDPRVINANIQPAICSGDPSNSESVFSTKDIPKLNSTFPAEIAEMSEPYIVRGVRMVNITTYPIQYDPIKDVYQQYDNIETTVNFTDANAVNPVRNPIRRNRSKEFLKFIRSYAINGDDVGRDDPDAEEIPEYNGHYLVVMHEECLPHVVPFIEWRRKSGWKVDILCLNADDALNANTIKAGIQQRYDAYLDDRTDPFDQLLLIGDLVNYANLAFQPGWVLASSGHHYDWFFGLLEGGDDAADVGISRWCAGSPDQLELFLMRTMRYEAEPNVDNMEWLNRAAVYAQRWGRNWHVSLPMNVRWGKQVLESKNFDDIRVYENYEQVDGAGASVGPFIRDQYNDGASIMIGRAENYYFRTQLPGVDNNDVFPIDIYLGGHQEYSVWTLLKTGTPNQPKGPVAVTCAWGNPHTLHMSVVWLEQCSAILLHDMTFGWARVKGVLGPRRFIPNFDNIARNVRTDLMYYGDPGIQYWDGAPRIVSAEFSEEIASTERTIEVQVIDEDEQGVSGAQVTFYMPGDMPELDDENYADYDEMFMKRLFSDESGMVRFFFEDDFEFENETVLITVTGRDILPFFGEIEVRENVHSIEIAGYTLTEIEGNDNGAINPGETFSIGIVATNLDENREFTNVSAIISTQSPYIEILNNELSFGDIPAGDESEADEPVLFVAHPSCPDGTSRPNTKPILDVRFQSDEGNYTSSIELTPEAPNFDFRRIIGRNEFSYNMRNIDIYITNNGEMDAPPMNARLKAVGLGVSIAINQASYPAIDAGRFARIEGERFRASGNLMTVPGAMCDMIIILSNEAGFVDTVYFDVQIDEARADSPTGPDDFGYICFDNTDRDWGIAPVYNWAEISPRDDDFEFRGTEIDFEGNSPMDIGETRVINLPFETQFYGRMYNEITVGSNGFISMGDQEWVVNYQNWPMDEAIGGGLGMVAPFWDNLEIPNSGGIYYYYDEEEARFIIEWYRVQHRGGDTDLTFQVMLYDHEVWFTVTGDQNILFQYKDIEDSQGNDNSWTLVVPFASIGISSPEGTTGINYSFNNLRPISAVPIANRRVLLFSTSSAYISGTLAGRVTDFRTGEPIEDAYVSTQHGFSNVSDEDGNWIIDDALAGVDFNLTCFKPGYNDSVLTELLIEEDDSLNFDFALLHPEFNASMDELATELSTDESIDFEFEISNTGNGTLNWEVTKHLRGGADLDPWEIRDQVNLGEVLNDSRIQGLVYDNDHFFVSGSNNREPQVYILNRDFELVGQFEQIEQGSYGFKDLAFDGELIWGSGSEMVYAHTIEGELIHQFEGPFNPNNNLAWDADRELLWVSSTTSNIIAIDREGNEVTTLNRQNMRIYGLSYYPADPDGFPLYILHRDADIGDHLITKMNPENGDTSFVGLIEPEGGGTPTSAFISNTFDVNSWVFMSMSNSGPDDSFNLWQFDARRDWFDIQPLTGSINAEEVQELTINLDAEALPPQRQFNAELVFHHNAIEGSFILPIIIDILGGRRNLSLDLNGGWNQISLNVLPDDLDVRNVLAPLVDNNCLVIAKNGAGQFYFPANNVNLIPGWSPSDGYQIFLSEPFILEVQGIIIEPDEPISLQEGWNLSAFYPRRPVDPLIALSGIREQLIIAKSPSGQFYLPEFNYSNLNTLREFSGYQYKVSEDVELIYQLDENEEEFLASHNEPEYFLDTYTINNLSTQSNLNMSVLLIGDAALHGFEIGAFAQTGQLIGAGCIDKNGRCGMAVWGDISDTDAIIEGAHEEEKISFKIWNHLCESDLILTNLKGESTWKSDDFFVGKITAVESAPVDFGIYGCYPNPANGPIRLVFGLPESGLASIRLFDINGRMAKTIFNAPAQTGLTDITFSTVDLTSGIYLVQLEMSGNNISTKIIVLK